MTDYADTGTSTPGTRARRSLESLTGPGCFCAVRAIDAKTVEVRWRDDPDRPQTWRKIDGTKDVERIG